MKEDDDFLEHLVLLRTVRAEPCPAPGPAGARPGRSVPRALCSAPQICLGADARDELHVVAVDSKNASGEHKPVPIAALRSSLLPTVRRAAPGVTPSSVAGGVSELRLFADQLQMSGARPSCHLRAPVWSWAGLSQRAARHP